MVCAKALALACAAALSVQAASAAVIDFSDITTADYQPVPAAYQPLVGVSIDWGGTNRYGSNTWDGGQDHTKSLNATAPSKDIGKMSQPSVLGATDGFSLVFSTPVEISSLWVAAQDGGNAITVKGYTHSGDSEPAVQYNAGVWWNSGGNATNAWREVTQLAGTPIERLQFVSTYTATWVGNGLGVYVDDITVTVPEPGIASLLALSPLAGLLTRRRHPVT